MARMLMAAMRKTGHRVELASRLRSYDGGGDAARQLIIRDRAKRVAARLIGKYQAAGPSKRPQAWFTYHLYHKAPDWLGPEVSRGLAIPYIVAEASHAPKQKDGPWALGHEASTSAIASADALLCLNRSDAGCLKPLLSGPHKLVMLKPFIDAGPYLKAAAERTRHRRRISKKYAMDDGVPWLLTAAMMRQGDKLASYSLLGEALAGLMDRPWRLLIAGYGPARKQVEEALSVLGDRVHWLEAAADDLAPLYAASDIYAWPAVNEAYGMALLEAQAAGMVVVAGNYGGVPEVVHAPEAGILTPAGDAEAFAAALSGLLEDELRLIGLGAAAQEIMLKNHDIDRAGGLIDGLINELAKEPRP